MKRFTVVINAVVIQVLVLGSGHVAAPLISYLARKPTELMVASVEPKELNALRRLGGQGREEWHILWRFHGQG